MKVGTFYLVFGTALALCCTACSPEKSRNEQMVNLEVVSDNPEAQLTNLSAAIVRSKDDGSLYARRAIVLLQKGELQNALADADQAVKLSRRNPAPLFVKAQVLYALGRPGEALPLALRAERNSYQSASLYVLLSVLYLDRKEYRKAREYVERALEIAPSNEYALYYKGRIQTATSDTARAIRNYKLALAQAPHFMEPQRELAGIFLARKDIATASQFVKSAMKLSSKDGMVWYYQGRLYQERQNPDSALISFERALALSDTLQSAHYHYGLALYNRGDNEGAVLHLELAAREYRHDPAYITTLASAYERVGRYQKALEQYRRLVALDPRYAYAYKSISRLKYKIEGSKRTVDTVTVKQLKTLDFNIK